MRHTLSKTEILRGYDTFSEVIRKGARIRSGSIECFVLFSGPNLAPGFQHPPSMKIGFAVPKKKVPHSVDRNRIKRLMREAYRNQKESLVARAERQGASLRCVLIFQQSAGISYRTIPFQSVSADWNKIAARILSMME